MTEIAMWIGDCKLAALLAYKAATAAENVGIDMGLDTVASDSSSEVGGPPYGLSPMPSAAEIAARMPQLKFKTSALDTFWTMTNIWGIETFYLLPPTNIKNTAYLLPQVREPKIVKNIQAVKEHVGEEEWSRALAEPSPIVQIPITTQMVRSFLRLIVPGLPLLADERIWVLNRYPSGISVDFWAVTRIRKNGTVKTYICPWPEDEIPEPLAPTSISGWPKSSFSTNFSTEVSQQCLVRFQQNSSTRPRTSRLLSKRRCNSGARCVFRTHISIEGMYWYTSILQDQKKRL